MNFIVDIQAFTYKEDHSYLPKEVAVLSVHKNYLAHWIVSPPVSYTTLKSVAKLSNTWLCDNVHGLEWTEDGISLQQLHSKLRRLARVALTITVYSQDVADYLEDVVGRSIITLQSHSDVPSYSKLKPHDQFCIYHGVERSQIFRCALNNVYRLREYILRSGRCLGDTAVKTPSSKCTKKSSLGKNKSTQTENETYSEIYDSTGEEPPQYI